MKKVILIILSGLICFYSCTKMKTKKIVEIYYKSKRDNSLPWNSLNEQKVQKFSESYSNKKRIYFQPAHEYMKGEKYYFMKIVFNDESEEFIRIKDDIFFGSGDGYYRIDKKISDIIP